MVRTHLAVITSPRSAGDGGIDLHRDVELVKAAVLYADSVEILSLGRQMAHDFQKFAAGPDSNMLVLLQSLDDNTLRHFFPSSEPLQVRQALQMLRVLNPDFFRSEEIRSLVSSEEDLQKVSEFADAFEEGEPKLTDSMAQFREIAEQVYDTSGVADLDLAMETGRVRYNDRVDIGEDSGPVIESFMHEVRRYLQDPNRCVLVDDATASLVDSMIKEGIADVPQRSLANASEAVLGTGFLSRLPTFPGAPMGKVLKIRTDLDDPLSRYRRKVTALRSHLLTGPFDAHVQAEVNGIWRTEVEPSVSEIRHAMADHTIAKELLRSVGTDLKQFAVGPLPTGGLVMVAGSLLDLGTAVTTGLTVGAVAAKGVADAVSRRSKGRATARANDLFYLHAVERNLSP